LAAQTIFACEAITVDDYRYQSHAGAPPVVEHSISFVRRGSFSYHFRGRDRYAHAPLEPGLLLRRREDLGDQLDHDFRRKA